MKLFAIMLMLASSVFAQNWVKVDQTENAIFYVDKSSIIREKELTMFRGMVSSKEFTSITDFATTCKSYVVTFERFETPDVIITRQPRKLQPATPEKGSAVESALNYVCFNTLKKDTTRGTIPQAE